MENFIEKFIEYIATEHPIALWIFVLVCCFGYLYHSFYKHYLRNWSSSSVRAKFKKDMKRQLKRLALILFVILIIFLIIIFNS